MGDADKYTIKLGKLPLRIVGKAWSLRLADVF